jgi:hypothetical protein
VREGDPQKDHEKDEEYRIDDQGKIRQRCVGFHLISFLTVSSPGGADLAARGLSFARHSLSVNAKTNEKTQGALALALPRPSFFAAFAVLLAAPLSFLQRASPR